MRRYQSKRRKGKPSNHKGFSHPLGYTSITREDVERMAREGYTTADAAFLLGIDRSTLWRYRQKWQGIEFPNSGKSAYLARVGYAR